jgi:hypothetical protein
MKDEGKQEASNSSKRSTNNRLNNHGGRVAIFLAELTLRTEAPLNVGQQHRIHAGLRCCFVFVYKRRSVSEVWGKDSSSQQLAARKRCTM